MRAACSESWSSPHLIFLEDGGQQSQSNDRQHGIAGLVAAAEWQTAGLHEVERWTLLQDLG